MRYGTKHEKQDLDDRAWGGYLAVWFLPVFILGFGWLLSLSK